MTEPQPSVAREPELSDAEMALLRERHTPGPEWGYRYCPWCQNTMPCPTIRLLNALLAAREQLAQAEARADTWWNVWKETSARFDGVQTILGWPGPTTWAVNIEEFAKQVVQRAEAAEANCAALREALGKLGHRPYEYKCCAEHDRWKCKTGGDNCPCGVVGPVRIDLRGNRIIGDRPSPNPSPGDALLAELQQLRAAHAECDVILAYEIDHAQSWRTNYLQAMARLDAQS